MDAVTPTGQFRLTEAIIVAILTGTAYLAAFAFEAGWATAFGYPLELINLQLVPTLFVTLTSLVVLLWLWNFADPLLAVLLPSRGDHPLVRELRFALAGVTLLLAFFMVNGFKGHRFIWGGGLVLAVWVAFNLLFPLIAFRNVKGYFNKLAASHRVDRTTTRRSHVLLQRTGGLLPLLLLCSLALMLSFTAGHARATQQPAFFVIGPDNEWVILRIYGSRAIAAQLAPGLKGFRPHYRVFNVDESEAWLTLETVGPLMALPRQPSVGPVR